MSTTPALAEFGRHHGRLPGQGVLAGAGVASDGLILVARLCADPGVHTTR